jgi:methyltransferase (TIGR00027 family)
MDPLGMTSRWVAAARARESARADRLFSDPLAAALAGDDGRALLEVMEKSAEVPGRLADNPYLAIRTRYIDDALKGAADEGVRQIAILAAGMDARAFRLEWPEGTTVFEVEREDVLGYKERVLAAERAAARVRRVVVASDLREDWQGRLRAAGHDPGKPTAFLVEGLMPYLPDEAAALAILSGAASIAAPGSRIVLDIPGASFLASPWMKPYLDGLAARGMPWLFGTDEPEALLEHAGWRDVRAVRPGDPEAYPGRWPFPVATRASAGLPQVFLVVARR